MKTVRNNQGEVEYAIGSDNVFADLKLPDADQLLAKAQLTFEIASIIEQRGLTQTEAAQILGVDQPKVSALMRGKLSSVSIERLCRYLNELGSDVEIVVHHRPRRRTPGAVRVVTKAAEVRNRGTKVLSTRRKGTAARTKTRSKAR